MGDDHVVAVADPGVRDGDDDSVGGGQHRRAERGGDVDAGMEVRVGTQGRLEDEAGRAEGLRDRPAGQRPRELDPGRAGARRQQVEVRGHARACVGLGPGRRLRLLRQAQLLLLEQMREGGRDVGRLVGNLGGGRLDAADQVGELPGEVVEPALRRRELVESRLDLVEDGVLLVEVGLAGVAIRLDLRKVALEPVLQRVGALPGHDHVGRRRQRVRQAAGAGDDVQEGRRPPVHGPRERRDLLFLRVDLRLQVGDLLIELLDFALQRRDTRLLDRQLVAQDLLARGSLAHGLAELLLRREGPGQVAAQARLQLVERRLVWVGAGPRAGGDRGRRAGAGGRGIRPRRRRLHCHQRCDRAGRRQGTNVKLHARTRLKLSSEVNTPRAIPATITAATTSRAAVSPTPGSRSM